MIENHLTLVKIYLGWKNIPEIEERRFACKDVFRHVKGIFSIKLKKLVIILKTWRPYNLRSLFLCIIFGITIILSNTIHWYLALAVCKALRSHNSVWTRYLSAPFPVISTQLLAQCFRHIVMSSWLVERWLQCFSVSASELFWSLTGLSCLEVANVLSCYVFGSKNAFCAVEKRWSFC